MINDAKIHEFVLIGKERREERDETLDKMNAKYAVVQIGGKMRVAYFEPSPVFKGVDVIVYSDRATLLHYANASG
jgi:hypothetical protein